MLQSVSEAYKAAERSADDVYHIALQDMSTQLQATASDRAACQTAIIKLQEYASAEWALSSCMTNAMQRLPQPVPLRALKVLKLMLTDYFACCLLCCLYIWQGARKAVGAEAVWVLIGTVEVLGVE